jgi:hypothetical protein
MNEPPQKRRFWQIHLSTAIVMILAAGLVLWFTVGRSLGPRQSDWVEHAGLAARISIDDATITPESPAVLTLDLKNTSAMPFRVLTRASTWGEEVIILPEKKDESHQFRINASRGKGPRFADFEVLNPASTLQHTFKLSADKEGWVKSSRNSIKYHGQDLVVTVEFLNGEHEPTDKPEPQQNGGAEIPFWHGDLTTAPIPIAIGVGWSINRIALVIAYLVGALVLTAIVSEIIIRRIAT